jgi:HlyD family secretion protein
MSLSQLYQPAISTHTPPTRGGLRRRILLLPAWLLPVTLVAAFAGLFVFVFRDRLLPALPVNAVPAILLTDIEPVATLTAQAGEHAPANKQAETTRAPSPPAGKMVFQAGGWIEPDPLPIYAIALADGVISKVHVLEGQEVKKGQVLAELIADDAKIALAAAERAHDRAVQEAKLQEVQVAVAEADAAAMADQIKSAEAKLAEERDNQTRIARIPAGSVSDQERTRAKFVVEGQVAEVAARKSQHAASLAKVSAARAQSAVLQAAVAVALVEVDKQKLLLSRMQIPSPVDGVVLELHAAPGQKKLLAMDDHQSATIASLFEKGKLQVRVDVPLADARGLSVGQQAVITSDFLPNAEFRGVVSRIVGSANLQRNTLQAKVRIIDPDPRMRPEMLCRVKFLEPVAGAGGAKDAKPAPPSASPNPTADASRAVMVPEAAVIPGPDDSATVWAIWPDGVTASKRSVTLGTLKREDHVAVSSGVLPGELIILPPHDQLAEGRRVRVTNPR